MAILALAVVVGGYFVIWHQQHVFAALPFLVILACPLMHLFMHGGHGGHGHRHKAADEPWDADRRIAGWPVLRATKHLLRGTSLAGSSKVVEKDLNATCSCLTLDRALLTSALLQNTGNTPVFDELFAGRSSLFSDHPVFLPRFRFQEMQAVVDVICDVAELDVYCAEVLSRAPAVAKVYPRPKGAFMGFDFHITDDGPKLIEVNTNAGGAFLNAALAEAQRVCCNATRPDLKLSSSQFEERVLAMFKAPSGARRDQWASCAASRSSMSVPMTSSFIPSFSLPGISSDATGSTLSSRIRRSLVVVGDRLLWRDQPVDLVYNRLVY